MYIQLIGRMLALPWASAETMPTEGAVPSPSSAARTIPSPAGGRGAARGRKGARCAFTAHGTTPGTPQQRAEKSAVGQECVRTCSYQWTTYKQKYTRIYIIATT